MTAPVRILHLHSSFSLGGKEARAVRLMNAFGDRARHVIVSGVPDALGARDAIGGDVSYEIAQNPPALKGKPSVARFEALARFMRGFDLVLTYNWGAIDGVMARRVFGARAGSGLPPLIHHEDGFNEDEAGGLKRERNLYRRIALPAAHALALPSETLEAIALNVWKQPPARVRRIPNGIDTALYAARPDPKAIPGLVRREGEVVIGTIAGLRAVKDLPLLVRACGGLAGKFRLVIVGEGPERDTIAQAAAAMGIADRLVMPGFLDRAYRYAGLFDIMALSSASEQLPIAVAEGMAAGLPIAAVPVGDVARMVAPENVPFIAPFRSEIKLRDALQPLMRDAALRRQVGAANRARVVAEFDSATMIARYKSLYEDAMGRPGALG
ncbi:Glycosyltransferase involved in cell wall bisynthesis [Sphingomonas gellani]|uniref:Glycosyltransferase involved in cell wall bisynthesis n=1 Tax=Sphingomonas gellani TaxID=1166340 RepID=A0A1H8EV62_9SPHN|nr:glycosyltransferase family 4 protein [Sphingomonas gellani]SEN23365.1 Glycosyltransferase involved in cell wall bisynthesis [Sphingomonas gellani]